MHDKLAVILVSADPKVLEMALIYTGNVVARGWMADLRLYLFGPAEVTVATDPDVQALLRVVIAGGTVPQACIDCSEKYGVSDKLRALGCEVLGIGAPVSQAIQDGYVPMTW